MSITSRSYFGGWVYRVLLMIMTFNVMFMSVSYFKYSTYCKLTVNFWKGPPSTTPNLGPQFRTSKGGRFHIEQNQQDIY